MEIMCTSSQSQLNQAFLPQVASDPRSCKHLHRIHTHIHIAFPPLSKFATAGTRGRGVDDVLYLLTLIKQILELVGFYH